MCSLDSTGIIVRFLEEAVTSRSVGRHDGKGLQVLGKGLEMVEMALQDLLDMYELPGVVSVGLWNKEGIETRS